MSLTSAGRTLFRWRSFTPVPLVALAAVLLWHNRGPVSELWLDAGLGLCLFGQILRAWTIGQVPDGTSGQNEKLIAVSLNTAGPYDLTRNPLYLGNLCITLGLCVVAHSWVLLVVTAALFGVQYRAIIAAEEDFLRSQFGAQFDEYCARVPRFWPRLGELRSARPWDWRRALRKEHNPIAAWIALIIVMKAWDAGFRPWLPYAITLGITLVAFLAIKGWKHHWFTGGFTKDLRRRLRETPR